MPKILITVGVVEVGGVARSLYYSAITREYGRLRPHFRDGDGGW